MIENAGRQTPLREISASGFCYGQASITPSSFSVSNNIPSSPRSGSEQVFAPTSSTARDNGPPLGRSATPPAKFVCPECGRTFTNRSNLNRHRSAKHTDNRYPCRVRDCGYLGGRADELRNHERRTGHGLRSGGG